MKLIINVCTKKRVHREWKELSFPIEVDVDDINHPQIHLQYGYRSWNGNICHEHDGVYAGRADNDGGAYRLLHQINPRQGDTLTTEIGGKSITWKVGEKRGFLNYENPILDENNNEIGTLYWEDYYKD